MALLELLIDEVGDEKCMFPENIARHQNIDSMETEK